MTIPHYHEQPATLDPAVQIPEDPDERPLAQGHLSKATDRAADVADAAEGHKEAVETVETQRREAEEAGEPEPGAVRTPDVIAKQERDDDSYDDESCPPSGTIDEVLTWVGDDHERAQQALDAERSGQNRQTLITKLEAI